MAPPTPKRRRQKARLEAEQAKLVEEERLAKLIIQFPTVRPKYPNRDGKGLTSTGGEEEGTGIQGSYLRTA